MKVVLIYGASVKNVQEVFLGQVKIGILQHTHDDKWFWTGPWEDDGGRVETKKRAKSYQRMNVIKWLGMMGVEAS